MLSQSAKLHLPQPNGHYQVYTDYSAYAISAILHQLQNGSEVPIFFASCTCKGREWHLASAEGELLAVIYGLSKFK